MNERILLIKHGALGDIIQGFDAFDSLRKGCPDAHISLLTTKPYEKLMKSSNWFDEVLIDQRATAWNIFQTLRLKSLLRMGWDKIIDLQCSKRTANLCEACVKGHALVWDCSKCHRFYARFYRYNQSSANAYCCMYGWSNGDRT